MTPSQPQPIGDRLREWRQRRRMSQLGLALEAEISTRHLSFIETGRSAPSRDMLLNLAERLDVPLRERNVLLVAAGYAPMFPERPLDDPALAAARRAVDLVLAGHEPYPALAVDRHWTLVASNTAAQHLIARIDPKLLQPPVNVLRLSLHPDGLGPRIANFDEWRAHILERLRRQLEITADPMIAELMGEIREYPAPRGPKAKVPAARRDYAGLIVPFELIADGGVLAFFSTTTVFGTPVEITLSELMLESFFPADAATAEAMRRIGHRRG
jgi:transcriptional regulator with XRE-family HTH domain